MTKAAKSSLVLDGNEVKIRLVAERIATNAMVHIDWVRFTVSRRNVDTPGPELLFPPKAATNVWDENYRLAKLHAELASLQGADFDAAAQAWELAETVADGLGRDFVVNPERRKGHDFYKYRFSIEREGSECGWVGFLTSSTSPRQQAQGKTIHVNLYGSACTFASENWRDRIADIVEKNKGTITRCDLALDFFDGIAGGMDRVKDEHKAGMCNVGGVRPKPNWLGNWTDGNSRSFYFGSKEAGKQTNVYEKGDQLFGVDACSPWIRVEVRYGNKLRDLPVEMLRRPSDFFAGSSDWHAQMLREASDIFEAETVRCRGRLAVETVSAEVSRMARWFLNTCAPTAAKLWDHAGDGFLNFVQSGTVPRRLRGFKPAEVSNALDSFCARFSTAGGASPVPA